MQEGGWPFPGPPPLGAPLLNGDSFLPTELPSLAAWSPPLSSLRAPGDSTCNSTFPSATWLQPWTAGEFPSDSPHSFFDVSSQSLSLLETFLMPPQCALFAPFQLLYGFLFLLFLVFCFFVFLNVYYVPLRNTSTLSQLRSLIIT